MFPKVSSRLLMLRGLALLHDILMAGAAFGLAILLRIGSEAFAVQWHEFALASLLFAVLTAFCGLCFGMNRGVWRYASIPDLLAIMKTATAAIAAFVVIHFMIVRLQ